MSNQIALGYQILRRHPLLVPLIMMVLLAIPLCLRIHKLGIYPDAVNPDYLAVRIIHWRLKPVAWVLPGNYIANHFPVLAGGLYHGSLHAYLAAPFLLFGANVTIFQLSHLFLALLVAMAVFGFLLRVSASLPLATAICALLMLDPSFTFGFLTQAYITTFPDAFVILACTLSLGNNRRLFWVGSLLGFAIWGYFIHLFFALGFFAVVFLEHRLQPAPRARLMPEIFRLAAGIGCGAILYVLGYGLLLQALGFQAGLQWLLDALANVPQLHKTMDLQDRLGYCANLFLSVLTGDWQARTIFATDRTSAFEVAKAVVLLLASLAAIPLAGGQSLPARGFRCMGMMLVSFLAFAFLFGNKLAGHHYSALTPVTYALFGASAWLLIEKMTTVSTSLRTVSLGAILAAIAAINIFFEEEFCWRIYNGESARLYSNEVNTYPMAARKLAGDYTHVFMNWGAILPFTYLTKGKLAAYDSDQLPALLCQSRPLKLVFTGQHAADEAKASLVRLKLAGTLETLSPPKFDWQYVVVTLDPPTTPRCTG